ncbi:MAG: Na(+)-translocating NADH-quinone reductase subunit C [Granulosicoccus sp.]|nr:Na(+)-translocating NADH-quinone reductase subunit C [Granulosicoccus sp.]
MNLPTDSSPEDKQKPVDPQQVVREDDRPATPSSGNAVLGRLKAILAEPNDSTNKTVAVTVIMCLACAIIVSGAAVLLRPLQAKNAALDRKQNILAVAGLLQPGEDVDAAFANIQRRMVDLDTGEFTDKFMDVEYDQYVAARDPDLSVSIPAGEDIAGIGRRARYSEVYLVGEDSDFTQIILPVNGLGLWSTLYGFVSLESDLKTISGLKFYDHAETPGLGGEVDNLTWQEKWKGKLAYDDTGDVRIQVIKGVVNEDAPDAAFSVDGLAGATLTSRGVSQLLRYWLDEQGFGTFLENLRQQGA